jgi:hypothetical protein
VRHGRTHRAPAVRRRRRTAKCGTLPGSAVPGVPAVLKIPARLSATVQGRAPARPGWTIFVEE